MIWSDDHYAAVDFETSGTLPEYALQPWRLSGGDFWATSLVWVWRENGVIRIDGGLEPDRPMMKRFLDWMVRTKRRGVGWNLAFDLSVFIAYGFEDEVKLIRWIDGMLIYRHLEVEPEYDMARENKRAFGLKAAVGVFLPQHAGYEETIDYHDPSPEARKKLHDYNIRDNVFALRITRALLQRLSDQQRRVAMIEADCLPMVAAANVRGFLIDTLACRELEAHLTKTAQDQLNKLRFFGVDETIVRSPVKLATLLFDQWKLQVLKHNTGKKTGKVSRATSKDVLHELSISDPRVASLRTYREALNNRTKFATTILNSVAYNGDGRSHPLARVFGTYTSRLTYSSKQGRNKDARQIGWAIHQEKRGAEFRRVLTVPVGYTMVEFDAAGQEYRWMAVMSGDQTMMMLCQPGEDPHSYMGSRIASCDYTQLMKDVKAGIKIAKNTRQVGKVGNLSLQYRTSAKKLLQVARVDYDIPMLLPEAMAIHSIYPRTYTQVPRYWRRQIDKVQRLGYAETAAGRRVKVVGDWGGSLGWSMGSTAINFPIQGTGGDQKYLAMSMLRPTMTKYDAKFLLDMHDGIYSYVRDDLVDAYVTEAKRILDRLPYQQAWGMTPPIPMIWDCKVGKTWGSLKEYEFT
jgi:DNA polymerase I-like protein with 3'-5' exonuclease and polymerase domains